MIIFKIYNNDKLRKWNGFPSIKDPNVLEHSLLRIINEIFIDNNMPIVEEFNINNPILSNMHFTYYTSSNFNSWGELPLGYIYNDMIRHIQNRNTNNNFIMTLESIFIDENSSIKSYDSVDSTNSCISYEIVSAYIAENYLNSYNYIINNNNGILVMYIPKENGLMTYIISVGFEPYGMAKWFSSSRNLNDIHSLPYARLMSLIGIVNLKLGMGRLSLSPNLDITVNSEMADGRLNENIKSCINTIQKLEINDLRKKSIYDTEVKYGNYPIDYNWLNIYDVAVPATHFIYTDKKLEKFMLNRFNQYGDYRVDYKLLKRQNDMIRINKIRKESK